MAEPSSPRNPFEPPEHEDAQQLDTTTGSGKGPTLTDTIRVFSTMAVLVACFIAAIAVAVGLLVPKVR